jgi:hypothetical protein
MYNHFDMKKGDDNKPVTYTLLQSTLKQALEDFGRHFGREMRDFVRQEIGASETRIKKEVTETLTNFKTEILEGVTDIIDNGIHPQLEDHEHRLARLETKTLGT